MQSKIKIQGILFNRVKKLKIFSKKIKKSAFFTDFFIFNSSVLSAGIEPASQAPQARILSIKLREQIKLLGLNDIIPHIL